MKVAGKNDGSRVWQCPRCRTTYRSALRLKAVLCVGCSRKLRAPVMGVWMEPKTIAPRELTEGLAAVRKTRGLKSVPEESA